MLLERDRLGIVHGCQRAVRRDAAGGAGIAIAQVTTAEELDPQAEVDGKDRLKRLTGKEIQIKTTVDPS